ncbi:methenyltetrahydromethanopterin cyclohydrolase [archaeon]|nr:methenyltetrahydromethanopterin cyclohydrolase [archaeon]
MLNENAFKIVEKMISSSEKLGIIYKKDEANIIDAGIKAEGSLEAGRLLAEICMGGLGSVEISLKDYSGILLPEVVVSTDKPALATLASQKASWNLKAGNFFSLGSGPARALARKPKWLYERLDYMESYYRAVIVLETSQYPPREIVRLIAESCSVTPENLYIIVAKTSSIAGTVQISARVVETALYKLDHMGVDTRKIKFAIGRAPVAAVVSSEGEMMGITNDMIIYGGEVFLASEVDFDINEVPSSASPSFGKPFADIFREADYDFYKINPAIFAPARVAVNFLSSKKLETAGEVALNLIRKSLKVGK